MQIGAVLVAAGLSSRMQGKNKMLLPFGDKTVIEATYQQLAKAGLTKVVVVAGAYFNEIKESLELRERDCIIENRLYKEGLTTSIQAGVKELVQVDAIMICLGDMPLLKTNDYQFLIKSFAKIDTTIQVPFYNKQKGNPVIFTQKHFNEILNHTEMNGCSGIVKQNKAAVQQLSVSTDRFILDIDTPEEYQNLLKRID
ncbi:nucleotidyltransferase family protein [Roseivirga pacifica]|uniref:nucleotidyltransferase family protein n=1 Tax=Roseivirga pacifica TaxID=1267423 RepID=UPI0020957E34|nr:nucleotidyltransferase family protein [Roseivirga pacifica]MCO6360604.1 NTP transferase domain-containing protein [Roseivirga pacifica]MCO6368493.1 NTP transferase domain-containing protein [Roseivirga pacifica]MCO6372635.1 NTP transferase domain-containing protein [Roseivirga pacifica]MCO6376693.1 NTP transferase domain-containing protein [Roseivirga pacifica]MCO6378027.1 NTP transferase domain-containing protein [Roseivirga pacifica]